MTELDEVDAYCDAVPRSAATVEPVGPFRLFRPAGSGHGWYARPAGPDVRASPADVQRVFARQAELGLSPALEWVEGRPAGLADVVRAAGAQLHCHPLLVARPDELLAAPPVDAEVRVLSATDDLARAHAVADVGFAHPGTAVGPEGVEALAPRDNPFLPDLVARGVRTVAAAYVEGAPVCHGSHALVGTTTEITGVATLPAFRRRGLAAAVTAALADDAVRRGATLVWLSADDEDVARVYARLGFRRIGDTRAAEPA